MSDLISRQKVLMYLADLQLSVAPDENKPTPTAYTVLEWAYEEIKNLPSAEPKKEKGKCPNKLPCGWCRTFDEPCSWDE